MRARLEPRRPVCRITPGALFSASDWIEENRKRHDQVAGEYNQRHPEIHNPTEQRRLHLAIADALARIQSPNRSSLDFGSGTGSPVVCVEPSPRALRLLRMNLTANNLDSRVSVVAAAAGDREGSVTVIETPPWEMGSSSVRDVDPGEAAEPVPMVTLDALSADLRARNELSVSLVKVDVEGFEERVLAGSQRLLETDHPVLVLELATSERRDQVSDQLERLGYRRFGPWCWTPTYVFASEWRGGLMCDLHYRLWRSLSRGRLSRWSPLWKRTRPTSQAS